MRVLKERFAAFLSLILISGLFLSCLDNNVSSDPDELTQEQAEERFLEFLKDEGYFSSSFFDDSPSDALADGLPPVPRDYISSEMRDSGHIVLNLLVDEEGTILPNGEWRNENSNYCMEQNRYMRAPVRLVQVQISPTVRTVFVRVVDIETSEILKQQEGTGDGDFWLDEAIEEAWNKVEDLNVEQADDPCSGEIEMELVFDSRIELQPPNDEYMISRVRAEISLTHSEETDAYSGEAPLVHQDYAIWAEEILSCTYDLDSGLQDATVSFPNVGVQYSSDIEASLGPRTADKAPSASWTCTDGGVDSIEGQAPIWWSNFVLIHEDNTTSEGFVFSGEWEEVDDPWTTAKLEINRSEPIDYDPSGEYIIKEETTILIRHAEN